MIDNPLPDQVMEERESLQKASDFEVTGTHEEQSLDYVTLVFAEKQKEEK